MRKPPTIIDSRHLLSVWRGEMNFLAWDFGPADYDPVLDEAAAVSAVEEELYRTKHLVLMWLVMAVKEMRDHEGVPLEETMGWRMFSGSFLKILDPLTALLYAADVGRAAAILGEISEVVEKAILAAKEREDEDA
jgi:hypothetical protein